MELLKKHSLNDEGTWHVFGEDPNCDLGGYHYRPDLGYITGTLKDVIHAAINIPAFWTWGGGGSIKKEQPPVAKSAKKVIDNNHELEKLLIQRDEIEARIKDLQGDG